MSQLSTKQARSGGPILGRVQPELLTPWSRILLEKLVAHHVQNSPPLVPILSQMVPVYKFPTYFSEIRSDILPSTPRSSEFSSL
jgi:hypothetical protein